MFGAEQGNGEKHALSVGEVEASTHFLSNMSMGDQIESTQGARIVKDHVRDEMPVELPIVVEYCVAERVAKSVPRRSARLSDGMRDIVRIDDFVPQTSQKVCRRGLSRPYPASDDNSLHSDTVAIACHIPPRRSGASVGC
jgi:hypothetical protein